MWASVSLFDPRYCHYCVFELCRGATRPFEICCSTPEETDLASLAGGDLLEALKQ